MHGLHVGKGKTQAVADWPKPANVREVRGPRELGAAGGVLGAATLTVLEDMTGKFWHTVPGALQRRARGPHCKHACVCAATASQVKPGAVV